MEAKGLLERVRIASPCGVSWEGMTGDDRARHCDRCGSTVYDLSALTAPEAEELIGGQDGRLCARLYRRPDGRVLTADCPVGARSARRRRGRRLATGAALGLALLGLGAWRKGRDRPGGIDLSFPPAPTYDGATVRDWTDWAMTCLRLRPEPEPVSVTMGMVCYDDLYFDPIATGPTRTGEPPFAGEPEDATDY